MSRSTLVGILAALSFGPGLQARAATAPPAAAGTAHAKPTLRERYLKVAIPAFDALIVRADRAEQNLIRFKRTASMVASYPLRRAAVLGAAAQLHTPRTPLAQKVINGRDPSPRKPTVRDLVSLLTWDPGNHLGRSLNVARQALPELFREHGMRLPEDLSLKITGIDLPGNLIVTGRSPSTGAKVKLTANSREVLGRKLSIHR